MILIYSFKAVLSLQRAHTLIISLKLRHFLIIIIIIIKMSLCITQYIFKFTLNCYTLIIHFWSLMGFKLKSEPLSVYCFSGCFLLSLCSSLDLSQPLSVSLSLSSSHVQNLMLFSLLPLVCCFSLHTYAALPSLALLFCLSLFFPSLSPGNQTSGEQC